MTSLLGPALSPAGTPALSARCTAVCLSPEARPASRRYSKQHTLNEWMHLIDFFNLSDPGGTEQFPAEVEKFAHFTLSPSAPPPRFSRFCCHVPLPVLGRVSLPIGAESAEAPAPFKGPCAPLPLPVNPGPSHGWPCPRPAHLRVPTPPPPCHCSLCQDAFVVNCRLQGRTVSAVTADTFASRERLGTVTGLLHALSQEPRPLEGPLPPRMPGSPCEGQRVPVGPVALSVTVTGGHDSTTSYTSDNARPGVPADASQVDGSQSGSRAGSATQTAARGSSFFL